MGPPIENDYVCTLGEETMAKAKRELREDPATRAHALKLMREWIAKHPDIRNCRTDAVFLLRFLRTRKFSVPQAEEMLERYLAMRQANNHWFKNLDVNDPIVHEIIESGYLVPLPVRDSCGRQVVLTCVGRLDPHKYTSAQVIRAHSVVTEVLMDDEETHVNGIVNIADNSGLTMSHISMWSVSDIRAIMRSIQKTLPMRLKGLHFINLPVIARQTYDFFCSLHSEKLRSRIKLHANLDDFRKDFGYNTLPKEYGGEIPIAEMISQFKEKMRTREVEVRALDSISITVKPGSKLSNEVGSDDAVLGVTGSFRKLEVD